MYAPPTICHLQIGLQPAVWLAPYQQSSEMHTVEIQAT